MAHEQLDLAVHGAPRGRDEHIRPAEVTVPLRDLVLEHDVVAEAVPDELRNLAVVLMGILAPMAHNDVRRRTRLQALEPILQFGALVREEAAVDPEVGVLAQRDALDLALRRHIDKMQTEGWPDGKKASHLPAPFESLDHLRQVHSGEAIAVVGHEHLFVLNPLAHGPQALADVAPHAGVDHGNAPILTRPAEQLNLGTTLRDHAVRI